MDNIRTFQRAAHDNGFVEVNESQNASVLWLRKKSSTSVREAHQRMCIDGLTKSATIYWVDSPGTVNSRTFRDVPALQEWCKAEPEITPQR
jgi:hypothetical protein